jgi:hypothetical protein
MNLKQLLSNSTNISKANEYKYLRPWVGFGLLTRWVQQNILHVFLLLIIRNNFLTFSIK